MNKLSATISQYRMILVADGIVSKEELIEMLKIDAEINDIQNYDELAEQILENIENRKEYTVPNNKKLSNENRMRLYKQGLSDKDIAALEKVCSVTIYNWRNERNLPSNPTKFQLKQLEKDEQRHKLYKQGLTDAEIAKICNEKSFNVKIWRERNNLLQNLVVKERLGKQQIINERRMQMFEKDYTVQEIATAERVSTDAIYKWMNRRMKVGKIK